MKLLLDTNVLLLWLVGLIDRSLVGTHKRLRNFDIEDFQLVYNFATKTPNHISTPHILAEVSNFLGSDEQKMVPSGLSALSDYVSILHEIYTPAKTITGLPEFAALGLADAGIYYLSDKKVRVISMDCQLCNRLAAKGVEAINPRNYRNQ